MKKTYIFDIECDGLLNECSKIHCLTIGWFDGRGNFITKSTTNYDDMKVFFSSEDTKIGHNIILFDCRVVEKILGIKVLGTLIDTLPLSWYLYPELKKHGLEEWGVSFGIAKPIVKDWSSLSSEEYIHRCTEDVKINKEVWLDFRKALYLIYGSTSQVSRLLEYISFKMDCIKEQEENPVRFNITEAINLLKNLELLKGEKVVELEKVMPKNPLKIKRKLKDVIVISEKEFYTRGDLMYNHYLSLGHNSQKETIITKVTGYEEPNANSTDQKKAWLYSLGWIPETFKHVEEDGEKRKVEQIMSDKKDGTLCRSVVRLFDREPKLKLLEGLTILTHRIGMVRGLIRDQKDGLIKGTIAGLTNTLRIKHKELVNLPGEGKAYGKEIRGLFIAADGELICGSDMSALEDTTKQHYIYNYDPDYVTEMRVPGFDPHLDIAVLSGMLTAVQAEEHKLYEKTEKKEGKSHKSIRSIAKTTNFSCTYNAGPAKIAQTAGISLREGRVFHTIYWKRNLAVKKTAIAFLVKQIGKKKWLFNPISELWYSLRAEKDRFSTGNQGTAVWCFDTWVKYLRGSNIIINYQCHDEVMFRLLTEDKDQVRNKITSAIAQTNKELNLNVPLGVSVAFGSNYANVH